MLRMPRAAASVPHTPPNRRVSALGGRGLPRVEGVGVVGGSRGGVRVGAARQSTGRTDLVAVEGPQTNPNFGALSTPAVNIFEPLSAAPVDSFFALNPAFTGGLYVAGNS